jgi:hypothetical protein
VLLGLVVATTTACGGAGGAASMEAGAGADADRGGLPSVFVASEGTGPALFLGPEPDAPAVGYVSEGVALWLEGPPRDGRVPVRIRGGLEVRAWLSTSRLGAIVVRRGRVRGAPVALDVGDRVVVRDLGDDGLAQVEVRPRIGDMRLGPFVGWFPVARLGRGIAADTADGFRPSRTRRVARERRLLVPGRETRVLARPGGRVLVTLLPTATNPIEVVVVRERGDLAAVRIGSGPRLLGWVPRDAVGAPLTSTESSPRAGHEGLAPTRETASPGASDTARESGDRDDVGRPNAGDGGSEGVESNAREPGPGSPERVGATYVADRLRHEAGLPLLRVRAGAKVRFDGRLIGVLRRPGLAREMRRHPRGEVDVFVAVDDDVALRGMVHARDLARPAE